MKTSRKALSRAVTMGAVCMPCGLLVGLHVRVTSIGDYTGFPYCSSLAALVAPAVAWQWLIEERERRSIPAGIFAGAVGVVLAHHLTWYFQLLVFNVQYWLLGQSHVRPMDPLLGFFGVSVFTAISLVMYGWLTIPFGLIVGGLMAHFSDTRR